MADANRTFLSSLPVRLGGTLAAIAIVAALMIRPGDQDPDVKPPDTPPDQQQDSQCEQEIERIISRLEPGRLSVQTPSKDLAAELNGWFKNCGVNEDQPLSSDEQLLKEKLDDDSLQIAELDRFRPADVDHIRFALLARQISHEIGQTANSDAQQVLGLFRFMCRYVRLVPDDQAASLKLPTTPYESILLGYASAEGRAWVFASMLEQLRLDSMVIAPADTKKSGHWLIGVNVPNVGILLFDPHLGLPIPGDDDDKSRPFPTSVATLSAVRNDDSLLRQLDSEALPYPLHSADLQQVNVQLIGSPILRSPRMANLQWVSTADADIYNGLGQNQLREHGALERAVAIGGEQQLWKSEDISIWQYPTTQLSQLDTMREIENSPYSEIMQVFAGPFLSLYDEQSRIIVEKQIENPLHVVRLFMLRGDHADALKFMGSVLSSAINNPLPANNDAIMLVQLWMGISQHETGYNSAAQNTFNRYTGTISTPHSVAIIKNVLDESAHDWKAETFLATQDLDQAAQTLRDKPHSSSAARDAYLINRWSALSSNKAKSTND